MALAGAPGGPALAGSFTEAQRAEILGILRHALRSDPSILREALEGQEAADRREREGGSRAAITAHADALFRDPADRAIGDPRGAAAVVEFFDPRCGYCKQMRLVIADPLRRNRDVRWVMRDSPIPGQSSVQASRALLAAQRQGKYAEPHDALLRSRGEPDEATLKREAERVGLDWTRLRRDLDDPGAQRRIEANMRLAQAMQIQGTPAMVVGGTLIRGAVDLASLERLVAEARTASARSSALLPRRSGWRRGARRGLGHAPALSCGPRVSGRVSPEARGTSLDHAA